MGGNGKHRWVISFSRSSSPKAKPQPTTPPTDFVCPISGSLMSDPVVVSSGKTFERLTVEICRDLRFSPVLEDGSQLDFAAVIPNLALKSTILSWCKSSGTDPPSAPDYAAVEKRVRAMMGEPIRVSESELLKAVAENPPPPMHTHASSELAHRVGDRFCSSSSEESVIVAASPETPLPLKTRPYCYSSSSSSFDLYDLEAANTTTQTDRSFNPNPNPNAEYEEEIVSKLKSNDVFEHENALTSLRKTTKSRPEIRAALCTSKLLSALKPHLVSRYISIQVNAVASMVNLSLEASNKVKIVRSGTVPYLIDVLKGGSAESQSHAAGALFSLAIDEDNKMAIGALGALEPLLHALRSETEQTRQDSALALYHLTLVNTNRVKLVTLNAVPNLLEIVKSRNLASRVLLVLCNLVVCNEGRVAMLDGNGVRVLVELLRECEGKRMEMIKENCVSALYSLSHGNFRFKSMLKEAMAMEVLREVERNGCERARDKAKRLLEMMKGEEDDVEVKGAIDWEAFLASGEVRWTRHSANSGANSSEF